MFGRTSIGVDRLIAKLVIIDILDSAKWHLLEALYKLVSIWSSWNGCFCLCLSRQKLKNFRSLTKFTTKRNVCRVSKCEIESFVFLEIDREAYGEMNGEEWSVRNHSTSECYWANSNWRKRLFIYSQALSVSYMRQCQHQTLAWGHETIALLCKKLLLESFQTRRCMFVLERNQFWRTGICGFGSLEVFLAPLTMSALPFLTRQLFTAFRVSRLWI